MEKVQDKAFLHCFIMFMSHVSLSWYIWYTKMKFPATKLITSKSQTKSKIIPNQELSISPKFSGKKRCSKASKSRQAQQKSFWSIHLETWKFKKTNVFWAQTFPRWNLYLPQKKTLPKPKLPVLMNIILPKKIAWVQQKHPSNQVPQTDVICKLDKWSKDCPSPRFCSGGNGGWEDLGEDGGVGRYGCHPGYLLVIRAGLGVGGGWVRKKLILNIIPQKIQQKKNPSAKKKVKIFCWVATVGMMWSFTTNQPPYLPRVKHRCSKRTCSIHHVGHWVLALQRSLQRSICDPLNLWLFYLGRSSI